MDEKCLKAFYEEIEDFFPNFRGFFQEGLNTAQCIICEYVYRNQWGKYRNNIITIPELL